LPAAAATVAAAATSKFLSWVRVGTTTTNSEVVWNHCSAMFTFRTSCIDIYFSYIMDRDMVAKINWTLLPNSWFWFWSHGYLQQPPLFSCGMLSERVRHRQWILTEAKHNNTSVNPYKIGVNRSVLFFFPAREQSIASCQMNHNKIGVNSSVLFFLLRGSNE
jgi:hypothetical protein